MQNSLNMAVVFLQTRKPCLSRFPIADLTSHNKCIEVQFADCSSVAQQFACDDSVMEEHMHHLLSKVVFPASIEEAVRFSSNCVNFHLGCWTPVL